MYSSNCRRPLIVSIRYINVIKTKMIKINVIFFISAFRFGLNLTNPNRGRVIYFFPKKKIRNPKPRKINNIMPSKRSNKFFEINGVIPIPKKIIPRKMSKNPS